MNKEYRGIVVEGNKEGRQFGFPTANIQIEHSLMAGVYSGYVDVYDTSYRSAIIINPAKNKVVEAHLIDFEGDLYGREICIRVGTLVREWMNFSSLEEGKHQIEKDINIIKTLNHKP